MVSVLGSPVDASCERPRAALGERGYAAAGAAAPARDLVAEMRAGAAVSRS